MNDIQIFNNTDFGEIRTVLVNNEPMFCLADICKALEINNISQLKTRLNQHGVITNEVIDSLGRKQNATFINEPNLYKTIFQSRKESAEKFTDWVTSEVLPQIRKTGSYALPSDYKSALRQLLLEVEEKERLALENKDLKDSVIEMDRVIGEMKPKVDYCDVILSTNECMTTSQVAQDYGKSAKAFNSMLFHMGVQYKVNGQWLLYSKYLGKGYTKTKMNTFTTPSGIEKSNPLTVWTQKGRMFLYNVLKEHGVSPLMETENE